MRFLSILALGAPLVSAVSFTAPEANATLTRGSTYDLQWSTVDTDSTAFSVYLVNFVNWPPYYAPLEYDVETASGEVSVRVPCDVDAGYGYQFNAINGTNVYIIYAQTDKFSIGGDSCTDPVTTASASTCAAAATATVTVTVRGKNSTSPTTAAPGLVTAGVYKAASNQTTSAPVVTATVTSTFPGTCPGTIGWSKDYNHPVTLTSIPVAGNLPVVTAVASAIGSLTSGLYAPAIPTGVTVPGLSNNAKSKCGSLRKKRSVRRHSDGGMKAPVLKRRN